MATKTIKNITLPLLLPAIACFIQWVMWDQIQPYMWIFFYPAVFFSAQLGGRWVGMAATVSSAFLSVFFFSGVPYSLRVESPTEIYSMLVFIWMGLLLSNLQEKFREDHRKLHASESDLRKLNNELEKRVEERAHELIEKEQRFHNLFDNMLEGVQLLDFDWRYIYLNRTAEIHNRRLNQDLLGMKFTEAWPSIEESPVFTLIKKCMEAREPGVVENEFAFLDGSEQWLEFRMQPVPEGVLIVSLDITERKKVESAIRRNEERYRYLFENNPHPMWAYDLDTLMFIAVNDSAVEKYGYSRSEFLQMSIADIRPAEELPRLKQFLDMGRTGMQNTGKWIHELKNGTRIVVDISTHSLTLDGHRAVLVVAQDVTEREKIEEDLRASEERFASIFRFSPAAIAITQYGTNIFSDVNEAWEDMTGYTRAEAVGHTALELQLWRNPEERAQMIHAVTDQGKVRMEIQMQKKNGEIIDLLMDAETIEINAKNYLLTMAQDITLRKRSERALHESNEIAQAILNAATESVFLMDIGGKVIASNATAARRFNRNVPDLIGANIYDLLPTHVAENRKHWMDTVVRERYSVRFEDVLYGVWMENSIYPIFDEAGNVRQVAVYGHDITDRKNADEALRESEQRFFTIFQSSPVGISLIDISTREIIDVNEAFLKIWGYSRADVLGRTSAELNMHFDPEENKQTREKLERMGFLKNQIIRSTKKTGEEIVVLYSTEIMDLSEDSYLVTSMEDITTRLKAEQDLINSNERFTELAENITDIFWVSEPGTRNPIYISAAFEKITGLTVDQVSQLPDGYLDILHLDDRAVLEKARLDEENGKKTDIQYRIIRPDGSVRWIRDKGAPIFDKMGKVVRVVGIASDITEQVEAERRINESELRFRQIAENIGEVFWMSDNRDKKLLYISPAFEAIWGIQSEHVYADSNVFFSSIHPGDRQIMLDAEERQMRGEFTELEYRIIRPDGTMRWIHDRSFPIFDEQGELIRTTGLAEDITRRKEVDIALRESENKYRVLSEELEERVQQRTAEVQDLYNNAPAGYHSLDVAGRVIMINQTELNWLGYEREEMVGHLISKFLSPASFAVFNATFSMFKETGIVRDLELDYLRKDGSILPVLISATAIYDENGNYLMSRSTLFDNTEHKVAEEAMRNANFELARAMRMKDEFLASMSHELRTPLTGILGLSEALQLEVYGNLNEKQKTAVSNIEVSGRHLLELINDILDVSKVEAGKLELQMSDFSLKDVCYSSLQLTKGLANKKHQKVKLSMVPENLGMVGDARRLKQVVVNLLSNAIKYTPEEGELGLDVTADEEEKIVRICVWDKGMGISPTDMQGLFQPFVQLDGSLARQQTGTGLGLVLVKRLVELHGGSVKVESVPEEGSRFTVSLPYTMIQPVARKQAPARVEPLIDAPLVAGVPVTVMIVDDNELNIEMMADFLRSQNFNVEWSLSGHDFLDRVLHVRPNLVLMDIQMPVMDGLEAIRRLRMVNDPAVNSIPVIAVTALAMPGDREHCLDAGANEYVTKPVQLRDLGRMINNFIAEFDRRNS